MNITTIGYLSIQNYESFIKKYEETVLHKIEFYSSMNKTIWSGILYNISTSNREFESMLSRLEDKYYKHKSHYCHNDPIGNFIKDFKLCFDYASEFNQKFNIIYTSKDTEEDVYYIVTFGKYTFLIFDNEYLSINMLKDYSTQTIAEIQGIVSDSGLTSLVPAEASNFSVVKINDSIQSKQDSLEKLKSEMSDVKSAKNKELAALQAEIDEKVASLEKKKQEMMEILEKKQAEMKAQMEQLQNQLFVLESEIYAIRCFLGEVVNFAKIKSGKSESEETPIILFQKMRYLDEEMGKLFSIYDFDGEDIKLFEKFITTNDDCLEMFCPAKKCISLVRCTKSGYHHAVSHEIANMLEAYEAYHGKTIGILIRDGENLYIGWTDEEKVNIQDDMFYSPGMKTYAAEEDTVNKGSTKQEIVSRYFIFSILQGVMENNKIIKLYGKHSFVKPDNMIIYSTADNWIVDNKYGSFSELIDKYASEEINKVGDEIIVIHGLRPDRSRDSWFNSRNDRGIGYADRTHDVSTQDGDIHKINHIVEYPHYYIYYVENDPVFKSTKYTTPSGKSYDYRREIHGGVPTEEELKAIEEKDNIKIVEHGYNNTYEYFISLFKDLRWDRNESDYKVLPKANFQVFEREYVNMTFLNSVWITYIIQNKNIGNLGWGNKIDVDYAYVIKYLNIMRKHLIKREKEEATLINEFLPEGVDITNIQEWQVKLSEWKFEHNIHQVGKRAAKQFAKYIMEN